MSGAVPERAGGASFGPALTLDDIRTMRDALQVVIDDARFAERQLALEVPIRAYALVQLLNIATAAFPRVASANTKENR